MSIATASCSSPIPTPALTSSSSKGAENEQKVCTRLARGVHRVVPGQLRGARRAAAWRLRRTAQSLPQGIGGAELLPADDPRACVPLRGLRVDLRAWSGGEAVARTAAALLRC